MPKQLDLTKISAAEQAEIKRLLAENEALNAKVTELEKATLSKDEKILSLEVLKLEKEEQIQALNKQIHELTKILVQEKELVKKYNLERYVTKADSPRPKGSAKKPRTNGLPSTVQSPKKEPGRPPGSKNFGDEFLETLAAENEPITLDIATTLLANNPNLSLQKIKEETSFLVKRIKARVVVYRVIMPIYKDPNGAFYREELPTPIFHSQIDASLLSDSITMKYFLGVPEYRYAKWLRGEGLPFTQKTINNWALQSANVLEPFYQYLKTLFTNPESNIENIHIDETWLDVIENKALGRDKNYVFAYSAITKHGKLPLFEYSTSRQTDTVQKTLQDYNAVVTVDGYTGYNVLRSNGVTIQRCLVHARREFANIVKTITEDQKRHSAAYNVVHRIDKIFDAEKQMRTAQLSKTEIEARRQSANYIALINDLETYLKSIIPEKGSTLEKAINYYSKMNGEQWTYLTNGNLSPHNNEAERQVKKFVIDRKNFLFARSEKGAQASCILLTVIDLAYVNDLDPRAYLEIVLNHVAKVDFNNLLPWSSFIQNKIKLIE